LTKHKKKGRRWVTKEQYIRYFMMCYNMLFPENGMTEAEQRESLAVGSSCTLAVISVTVLFN
jgi:hypothetical protein